MRALLVLLAAAVAAQPAPPPPADAYACTAVTLAKQERCYLEGEVLPSHDVAAQAKENVREAESLADRACASAATADRALSPDAGVLEVCAKELRDAADRSCSLDGRTPLFDADGRFAPGARDCYDALGGAIRRARTMTAVDAPCCRCLAKSCALDEAACDESLFDARAGADIDRCVAKSSCRSACTNALPAPDAEPATRTPPPANWY